MKDKKEKQYKVLIVSCHRGISDRILQLHKKVITKTKTKMCVYYQAMMSYYHGKTIDNVVEETFDEFDIWILLDVDCIPISVKSIPFLINQAKQGKLVGCAQRANHLDNNKHIYVSPFCMAFSKDLFKQIGKPSFMNTHKGDTGEELTYLCERKKKEVVLLYPSDVVKPIWDLDEGKKFGIGTTYERLFYHQFGAREEYKSYEKEFIRRCNIILGQDWRKKK